MHQLSQKKKTRGSYQHVNHSTKLTHQPINQSANNLNNPINPINPVNPINPTNPIYQDRSKYFLITIDVEDWFHVENFKSLIPFDTWGQQESRIERNIHRLLDLFDSLGSPSEKRSKTGASKSIHANNQLDATNATNTITVRATFFVLCWIAEHFPHLVREIAARGHEVASHGCYHELPQNMLPHLLRAELSDSRKRLEDTIGMPVLGFRAPSFSINDEILEAVAESGYLYDSSYNSFSLHGRYGKISLNGQPQIGIAHRVFGNLYELPISNLKLRGKILPLGGGAYFRLMFFSFFRLGVKQILRGNNAYLFYIHPWEIDPGQPRMEKASWNHKIRHYTKLSKTYDRLVRIISAFKYCRFITCSQYLEAQDPELSVPNVMCAS
jgi:polysaccharide deacetylase family protein (PEP-CTERM system associated)